MARYSVAFSKTTTAAAGPICDFRTAAKGAILWEIWVSAETAVSGTLGLVRVSNAGTTPGGDTVPQAEDYSNTRACTVHCYTTYGTEPTQNAVYLRRCALPATVGSTLIWTFPQGITIPPSGDTATLNGVLLRQVSTAAVTYSVHAVLEE